VAPAPAYHHQPARVPAYKPAAKPVYTFQTTTVAPPPATTEAPAPSTTVATTTTTTEVAKPSYKSQYSGNAIAAGSLFYGDLGRIRAEKKSKEKHHS